MQRAIAIAVLAVGDSHITNACFCNDTNAVLQVAEHMGASIKRTHNEVWISPSRKLKNNEWNLGESGLGIRMLTPVASLFSEEVTLTGQGSLKTRPMSSLEDALNKLGVEIYTTNGRLPIRVKGPLRGGEIQVDGSLSSQILTGLLISLPIGAQSSVLEVHNLQSKPYIDMTVDIMATFGVSVSHDDYKRFCIKGTQNYTGTSYCNEGDWSGAAFHLVGGAIAGDINLTGLRASSKQADVQILTALKSAGAEVSMGENSVRVKKNTLQAFEFDATHCPDLFPPLANLAAACTGVSVIKGVGRLAHKESDRASALQTEWAKLGITIQIDGDDMHIHGGQVMGGEVDSHNDHRIAMMGAIAGLISSEAIHIKNPEAVGKSCPTFYADYTSLTH